MGYGVHLFIYGTKRAAFWIAIWFTCVHTYIDSQLTYRTSLRGKNLIRPISGLFSPQNKLLFIKVSYVDFEVAWHFCETLEWFVSRWESVRPIPVLRWGWWVVFQHGRLLWAPPSWIPFSIPDWLKITSAILDLENNRVYCSRNNSLLSFSAPDWLPPLWACYCWFSHDVTKFQTSEILILQKFYFHAV